MITLSVIVPATDSPVTLARCHRAIAGSASPAEEVIVVERPHHLSAAAARNVGAARATGDVVVFVDADVEVHPDALTRIRAAFEDRPELTAVFGSYDDEPHDAGLVSSFRNLLHHHVHQASAGPAETFWTGLGAVRRSSFVAVGGFDAARFPHPSVEDIELGGRLRRGGGQLQLDPSIQGTHLKAWTLRSMLWTDLSRRGIPWVALQVRDRRPSAALNCGWRHRASAAACAVAAAGTALGRHLAVAGALATLVVLNRGFYALLVRRRGVREARAGVVLHGLHHLVAIAAVPAGIAVAVISAAASERPLPSPASTVPAEGSYP